MVALALHGLDAYGLDVAAAGVAAANHYASKELKSPQAYNFAGDNESGAAKKDRNPGQAKFIEGDLFNSDWESQAASSTDIKKFDIIYDYTVNRLSNVWVLSLIVCLSDNLGSSFALCIPACDRSGLLEWATFLKPVACWSVSSSLCTRTQHSRALRGV